MCTCHFCQRDDFSCPQSVYAHLKRCPKYLQHKQRKAALGTSLRHAVPKAPPHQTPASPIAPPPPSSPPSDQLEPFKKAVQAFERSQTNTGDTQETPQQRRRRVLQTAKNHARDHGWSFTGTVTAEMRAAGTWAIERQLRHEPIEEWTVREVNELAGSVSDRVYTSFLRRQEKEAQRTRDADVPTSGMRNAHRQNTERRKWPTLMRRSVD